MQDPTESVAQAITNGGINNNQTAKKAAQILLSKNLGFVAPTTKQKRNLLVAFARHNLVIYGKAFDLLRTNGQFNLDDEAEVERHWSDITLYEVKSTNKTLAPDFSGYFFALTTAELLVAQSLKSRYKFAFVNTVTQQHMELTLPELLSRAKGIYPTWSISF